MRSLSCGATSYPTRNFATLGTVVTQSSILSIISTNAEDWTRSFLPDSPCRHEGRTVSSSSTRDHSLAIDEPRVQSLRIPLIRLRVFLIVVFHWRSFDTPFGRSAQIRQLSNTLFASSRTRCLQTTESLGPSPTSGVIRRTERQSRRALGVPRPSGSIRNSWGPWDGRIRIRSASEALRAHHDGRNADRRGTQFGSANPRVYA